jgi:hypothetical protein
MHHTVFKEPGYRDKVVVFQPLSFITENHPVEMSLVEA